MYILNQDNKEDTSKGLLNLNFSILNKCLNKELPAIELQW